MNLEVLIVIGRRHGNFGSFLSLPNRECDPKFGNREKVSKCDPDFGNRVQIHFRIMFELKVE